MVRKTTAFWDSSALVPLCIHEITSRQAQSYLRRLLPVVWWASAVEVHSAISRLHRLGKLKDIEKKGALARLEMISRGWREILPGDQLRGLATRLLDIYELRAADSLQLAAALTVSRTPREEKLRMRRPALEQGGRIRGLLRPRAYSSCSLM